MCPCGTITIVSVEKSKQLFIFDPILLEKSIKINKIGQQLPKIDMNEINDNKQSEEQGDAISSATLLSTPSRESVAQRIISWGAGAESPYRNTTAARLEREKELETVAQARIRSISTRENSHTDNDLVPGNSNSSSNLPICALCEKVCDIQSIDTY